ncbi:hypothetical protein GUITHDRAFT_116396 [Guillardia theta CCMP2712]|uniref:PDZ domain-containing protein n=1 Tax=Guillardia theta (strain CCMP2712) TaxID=905079 RepID=L1INP4_GUITC|nr:hypothetical protein GUITHDRAFT_116396 [Guillardia theta CCMP2712]EKX37435.1 hypothetical protein GUITHDRAFT_116396 [Guillardia theta CCMP2712]|eukprot:XP_005824415.1 hypothetical protein GUITHDRAFT_116396 [Guillardia theta CCMP2712]
MTRESATAGSSMTMKSADLEPPYMLSPSRGARILADGRTAISELDRSTVQASKRIGVAGASSLVFFEVTVIRSKGCIVVGLARYSPTNAQGWLFHSKSISYGAVAGDVIICGVRTIHGGSAEIFFSRNGVQEASVRDTEVINQLTSSTESSFLSPTEKSSSSRHPMMCKVVELRRAERPESITVDLSAHHQLPSTQVDLPVWQKSWMMQPVGIGGSLYLGEYKAEVSVNHDVMTADFKSSMDASPNHAAESAVFVAEKANKDEEEPCGVDVYVGLFEGTLSTVGGWPGIRPNSYSLRGRDGVLHFNDGVEEGTTKMEDRSKEGTRWTFAAGDIVGCGVIRSTGQVQRVCVAVGVKFPSCRAALFHQEWHMVFPALSLAILHPQPFLQIRFLLDTPLKPNAQLTPACALRTSGVVAFNVGQRRFCFDFAPLTALVSSGKITNSSSSPTGSDGKNPDSRLSPRGAGEGLRSVTDRKMCIKCFEKTSGHFAMSLWKSYTQSKQMFKDGEQEGRGAVQEGDTSLLSSIRPDDDGANESQQTRRNLFSMTSDKGNNSSGVSVFLTSGFNRLEDSLLRLDQSRQRNGKGEDLQQRTSAVSSAVNNNQEEEENEEERGEEEASFNIPDRSSDLSVERIVEEKDRKLKQVEDALDKSARIAYQERTLRMQLELEVKELREQLYLTCGPDPSRRQIDKADDEEIARVDMCTISRNFDTSLEEVKESNRILSERISFLEAENQELKNNLKDLHTSETDSPTILRPTRHPQGPLDKTSIKRWSKPFTVSLTRQPPTKPSVESLNKTVTAGQPDKCGVGVMLIVNPATNVVNVTSVVPGDVLMAVDGHSLRPDLRPKLDDVVKKIVGGPGTVVNLTLSRPETTEVLALARSA